jgi:cobalt-zinc-cadmium efflux system protein
MGHDHSHGAMTAGGGVHRRRLVTALVITGVVLVAEVVGSLLTGSLALLADAGHVLTDMAGLVLAVLAITLGARPATARRTFGYYRLEILAAVANATLLLGVAVLILVEAVDRWRGHPHVEGGAMLGYAAVGLVANVISLVVLREGAGSSLNVKGAYLEVMGDLIGSVGVIVAAGVIAATGWDRVDVIASVFVAVLILPRTWHLLREAIDVLLEATPKGVDLEEIRQHILDTPGVLDAHDLHAWTITSGMPVLSVHVVVTDAALADGGAARVLDELSVCLADHFDVEHCTFQLEPASHAAHETSRHP